jgi:hypothetical protein
MYGQFQIAYRAARGPSALGGPSQVERVTWSEFGFRRALGV